MSEETKTIKKDSMPQEPAKKKSVADKRAEHIDRIKRTLSASFLGLAAGIAAFFLKEDTMSGILFLAIAIIMQRYLFIPLRRNMTPLGAKDWFYQGFMTFSLWFISWTILLTTA
ncbi:MAG: hypothetical protein LUO82_05795 [Methanomicrobiales archaeon]|nr:hypothetical protein [Methanomicrobiales archaeon]